MRTRGQRRALVSIASVVICAGAWCGCGRVADERVDTETHDAIADDQEVVAETSIETETSIDTEPESPSDTTPTDGAKACTPGGDACNATEYCNAPKCTSGTCEPRPTAPSVDFAPVCGCDDITYWNADQAAARGVSIRVTGNCGTDGDGPGACGPFYGDRPCPTGTVCVIYYYPFSGCSGDVGGHCWFIPADATCPSGGGGYRDCTTSACIDFCEAIRNGSFHPDGTCPG